MSNHRILSCVCVWTPILDLYSSLLSSRCLFVFIAASSLFSICPHSPFVIPFSPCFPLLFLFLESLSSSSSLTLVNAVQQEVHSLYAIQTAPSWCFAVCLDEMEKLQLKACFSLAASFISQYVGHLCIQLSCKGVLTFVTCGTDELHFFI